MKFNAVFCSNIHPTCFADRKRRGPTRRRFTVLFQRPRSQAVFHSVEIPFAAKCASMEPHFLFCFKPKEI
jgi:hypothetical protein